MNSMRLVYLQFLHIHFAEKKILHYYSVQRHSATSKVRFSNEWLLWEFFFLLNHNQREQWSPILKQKTLLSCFFVK